MRLLEFSDQKSDIRSIVKVLQQKMGRLQRVGGPSRVYEIEGTDLVGAVYVIGDTLSAIGVACDKSTKQVKKIYLWSLSFTLFNSPDYEIDLPDVVNNDLADTIVSMLQTKKTGTVAVGSSMNEARRSTDEEFIRMARDMFGAKASKLSLVDLNKVAIENDVQIPSGVKMSRDYKALKPDGRSDPHHWNLSDGSSSSEEEATNTAMSAELGAPVETKPEYSDDYQDVLDLAKAKSVTKMASKGKVYLMGKKSNGNFFKIPNLETYSAQLERLLVNQLEANDPNRQNMDEQYDLLRDKVRLVAGGKSAFIKSLLIMGAPSSGKALALDTPIPTPTGWTTMGEINVGDKLFDENGKICEVIDATGIQLNRDCYEVEFDDGTVIVADAEHRWLTSTNASRYSESRSKKKNLLNENRVLKRIGTDQSHKRTFPSIVNTKTISETVFVHGKKNHQIVNCLPVETENNQVLLVKPYILGLWLGDGSKISATLTCGNEDIEQLTSLLTEENQDFKITKTPRNIWHIQLSNGLGGAYSTKLICKLREIGVYDNKHIPMSYLRSSVDNRLALLQGLMDTDGCIGKTGSCEFTATDHQLAQDFLDLALGLGIKATLNVGRSTLYGVDKGEKYRVIFSTKVPVFRFQRKLARINQKYRSVNSRTIVRCTQVKTVPVKCIAVDSPSNLFLCSRSYIPTHNTFSVMSELKSLGLKNGRDFAVKKGKIGVPSLYRTFIEQIDGLIIFDDADSVFDDKDGRNMIKNALDTYPVREIGNDMRGTINTAVMEPEEREEFVNSISRIFRNKPEEGDLAKFEKYLKKKKSKKSDNEDSEFDDYDEEDVDNGSDAKLFEIQQYLMAHLPNMIDFKGRVIFISNMDETEMDSAILTRTFIINMNFTSGEMLDYIDKIKNHIITPNLSDEEKQEVMDYVRDLWTIGKLKRQVNFRLIQQAFDLYLTSNWRKLIGEL